jgi:hypothetical protein
MGTATHPQKKNESNQSYAPKQPFKCAGITNNGVCIGRYHSRSNLGPLWSYDCMVVTTT